MLAQAVLALRMGVVHSISFMTTLGGRHGVLTYVVPSTINTGRWLVE